MDTLAFDPNPALKWVVLLAHPDDEVCVGGWLHRLRKTDIQVDLIWLHSTGKRRPESERACDLIGIEKHRRHFFEGTDGHVAEDLPVLLPTIFALLEEILPDRILCLTFEQGHPDHDSVCFVSHVAAIRLESRPKVVEFPIYHTYLTPFQSLAEFANPDGEEILELNEEETKLKSALVRCYPSQTIYRNVLIYGFYRRLIRKPLDMDRRERAKVIAVRDFTTPNYSGQTRDKLLAHPTWQKWRRAIDRLG